MTTTRSTRGARALVLGGLLAAAIAPVALAADHAVTIEGQVFSPGRVTVVVGDTVTWTNFDGASHTATADDGSFDTGGIPKSSTDTIRFTSPGEVRYHCSIHPDMVGRVLVVSAGRGEPTTPPTDTAAVDRAGDGHGDAAGAPPAMVLALAALVAAWVRRLRVGMVADRSR